MNGVHLNQMRTQVIQYKNLSQELKNALKVELPEDSFVYLIKDLKGNIKTLTTSVTASIQKTQANILQGVKNDPKLAA